MSYITDRDIINIVKEFYKAAGRFPTLAELESNGVTRESIRQRFVNKGNLEAICEEELSTEILEAPIINTLSKLKKRTKTYIIAGVQNNTHIDQDILKTLTVYAKHNNAEILLMPMYYRNPTSIDESNRLDCTYWWDDNFDSSICHYITENIEINKNLLLVPEHRINVTAANPLSGLELVAGKSSAIFANPHMMMKLTATPQDKLPYMLHTTGTICSTDNFSKTNAGGKAKSYAVPGAIVVNLDGDLFHIRQLEYKEGCICDLDKVYTSKKVTDISTIGESCMVWGDIHAEIADKVVVEKSKELAEVCNVGTHYIHDVLDFACQSHHNRKNYVMKYFLSKAGKDNVELAIRSVAEFINQLTENSQVKIVDSNHHDHLYRWLNEADFKQMGPDNAYFYICLMKKVMEEVMIDDSKLILDNDNILKLAIELLYDKDSNYNRVEFLDRNKSHSVHDIELSQHGDIGLNGARGSIAGLSKTAMPMVIGHSHSPGIYRGIYQVGKTAYMQQSYTSGMSTHLHTHCIIYPNGGRTLVNILAGRY